MATKQTKRNKRSQQAAIVLSNVHTKSAPQLSARSRTNENKRLGSAIPRSRRSHGTTSAKSLSPVSKKKPQRASDTSFLDRLAAKSRSKARPRTAGPVTCSASGKWSRPGGGRFSLGKPKSETDWIIKRSRETPGPGQYSPAYVRKNRAVKISNANPKSETDWIILRSSQKPGPGAYSPQNINRSKGLKISDANPKSDLDWVIHRSKQSPAPNAYQNPMSQIVKSGGKFSTAKPKTETEILMMRSSESPGPNQYSVKLPPSRGGAGKISDANPLTQVDLTILRAKDSPGPNQYMPQLIRPNTGVKFSDSNPKSEVDWIILRAKNSPGPSAYDISWCPMPASSSYLLSP